jgi:hypothetical protein
MSTATGTMITVNIPVTIDGEELWSETFGSGWEYAQAPIKVTFKDEAEWDKPGLALVKIHNGEEWQKAELSMWSLATAYAKLAEIGYHHCGAPLTLGDFDACASFDMLQMAVFGELIYG